MPDSTKNELRLELECARRQLVLEVTWHGPSGQLELYAMGRLRAQERRRLQRLGLRPGE